MKQVIWTELSKQERAQCLQRPAMVRDGSIEANVRDILSNVQTRGDDALRDYSLRFDKVALEAFEASADIDGLNESICAAIDQAYANISAYHAQQGYRSYSVETMSGVKCKRIVRPISRAGLYVPGGSAPLVSTTLMLGVPAQIAGCSDVVLCTPCDQNGAVNPYILYAAQLCGITRVFRLGGAQAIGAMAYGTKSIPKCDKIFGPGNAYVTEAKMQVSRDAGGAAIDMPAGPSEVCVIADASTNPDYAAADLLSQAEHDTLSQVVLIGLSKEICEAVMQAIEQQISDLPRRKIAATAIKNSIAIVAASMDEALDISNAYAPEHLILCFEGADAYLDRIKHAGSIFLGPYTPEAIGDYASGTNHVLPTYGYARGYSGLGVEAFQKTMSVQEISRPGIEALGPIVETLAELEGLEAHRRAVAIRVQS